MLTLTHPRETAAHRLPAGVKLAALAALAILIFRLGPLGLSLAGLVLLGTAFTLGRDVAVAMLRGLIPLWPFVLILSLWHLVTGQPEVGGLLIARMLITVAAANLVTLTTPLTEMITVIERVLTPLRRIGIQPHATALAMALVVRFAPVLLERQRALSAAWRARSLRRPGWRLALPLTLAALDDADHVADALKARGGVAPAERGDERGT